MELEPVATVLLSVLAVTFVIVGSYYAVTEYRYAQQCHDKYDGMEGVYADCEDFNYAVGVFGGSTISIIGVGVLVLVGRS